jgi:hypothetical protein
MTALLAAVSAATQHAELLRAVVLARIIQRLAEQPQPAHDGWLDLYAAELATVLAPGATLAEVEQAWTARLDAYERSLASKTPMSRLTRDEALLVSAAGLVEDDLRFGSMFAILQAPLRARRPCIGLLGWLVSDPLAGGLDDRDLARRGQRLARRGVLEVTNPSDPRAEWVVRVSVPVWELLQTGSIAADSLPPGLEPHPAEEFPAVADVWVDEATRDQLPTAASTLAGSDFTALVVRGPARSGRRTLLGALAREQGRDLLICQHPQADPDAWRTFAALVALGPVFGVVRCRPGFDETLVLAPLPGVDRAIGITAGPAGGLAGEALRRPFTLTVGHCGAEARRELWLGSGLQPWRDELAEITESFLLTPGNLLAAADLVQAGGIGAAGITADDVRSAVAQLHRQQLEPLATKLQPLGDLRPVLSPAAEVELDTLLMRCRHRERLAESQATADRGVRALFSGPSGTGKSLAARYLACCLALDAYRVNLASIVNKYIGETEKNLDRVLSAAEELGVVLLLDEGDALLARRTDVSDANDRYANLETNYLLQRLETFSGIVLITSNAAARIDSAFLRRIDVTVDFVPPNAEQRWLIWCAHLGLDHRVSEDLLTEVARRCPLTGGVIRNAALHATLLAIDDDQPLSDHHLLAAVRREYRRQGGTCPLPERP